MRDKAKHPMHHIAQMRQRRHKMGPVWCMSSALDEKDEDLSLPNCSNPPVCTVSIHVILSFLDFIFIVWNFIFIVWKPKRQLEIAGKRSSIATLLDGDRGGNDRIRLAPVSLECMRGLHGSQVPVAGHVRCHEQHAHHLHDRGCPGGGSPS